MCVCVCSTKPFWSLWQNLANESLVATWNSSSTFSSWRLLGLRRWTDNVLCLWIGFGQHEPKLNMMHCNKAAAVSLGSEIMRYWSFCNPSLFHLFAECYIWNAIFCTTLSIYFSELFALFFFNRNFRNNSNIWERSVNNYSFIIIVFEICNVETDKSILGK